MKSLLKFKLNITEILLIIYQIIIVIFIGFYYTEINEPNALPVLHIFSIIFLLAVSKVKNIYLRLILPMILLPFLFNEIIKINKLIFSSNFDYIFINIDKLIFRENISLTFAVRFSNVIISEIINFLYCSYYYAGLLLCFLFFKKQHTNSFKRFMFVMFFTFIAHYIIFIIFPVAGPKYYFEDYNFIPNHGYIFPPLVDFVLKNGDVPAAAFPSSHVAVTFIYFVYSSYINKLTNFIYLIILIGVCLGTVYTYEHYFTDVIGGLISGYLCYIFGKKLYFMSGFNLHKKYEVKK